MKLLGLHLFVLISIFLFSSCSKGAKAILEKAQMATFIIYTFDEHGSPAGSGSGFFISKDGIGITNYHVLDKSMKAVIRLKDGKEYEIDKVIASDKKWDIVKFSICKEENEEFHYLDLSTRNVEQGDKVYNLSAPLGLEQTYADGLVSSIRTDSHGQVVQVTIPISQGSSGSPIINESGKVVAVATFKHTRGESLNFGVEINEEKLSLMASNPFSKSNRQFNNKEGFVVLNIPSDQDNDLVLNALQFKSDVTIAYFSYTNLDMSMNGSEIWCPTGLGDKGFYIENKENGRKYYIVSSNLGKNNKESTSVPLATVCKFQVNFPAIDRRISKINVSEGGNPKWSFSDIDLNNFKKTIKIDFDNYHKEYAYSTMHEGEFDQAQAIFEEILEDDPENIQALNALGIISYTIDNNQDAIKYFTEVIENHPNSTSGYLNRCCVYKYQGEFEKAIIDISKAINIDSNESDLYIERADLYAKQKKWDKAKEDIERALTLNSEYSSIDVCKAYYRKGLLNAQLGNVNSAIKDLENALHYTDDSEMKQAILTSLEKISPQYYSDSEDVIASSYFSGLIGTFPITVYLKFAENREIKGWYYYNSRGSARKLALSGFFDEEGHVIMNEYTTNGENSGKFDGVFHNGEFRGTFYVYADSQTYDFNIREL